MWSRTPAPVSSHQRFFLPLRAINPTPRSAAPTAPIGSHGIRRAEEGEPVGGATGGEAFTVFFFFFVLDFVVVDALEPVLGVVVAPDPLDPLDPLPCVDVPLYCGCPKPHRDRSSISGGAGPIGGSSGGGTTPVASRGAGVGPGNGVSRNMLMIYASCSDVSTRTIR